MTIAVLTKMGWRVDGTGRNRRTAYNDAKSRYNKILGNDSANIQLYGELTEYFHIYNKSGFYAVGDPLYSIK